MTTINAGLTIGAWTVTLSDGVTTSPTLVKSVSFTQSGDTVTYGAPDTTFINASFAHSVMWEANITFDGIIGATLTAFAAAAAASTVCTATFANAISGTSISIIFSRAVILPDLSVSGNATFEPNEASFTIRALSTTTGTTGITISGDGGAANS